MLKKDKYKSFFNSSLNGLSSLHPIVIIDYNVNADFYSPTFGEYGLDSNDRIQVYKDFDRESILLSTDPGFKIINGSYKGNTTDNKSFYFEDRDLSIPSISESIDIEERKFKLSNVDIKINNYPIYLDKRTSDLFKNNNYINKFVKIFYASSNIDSIKNKKFDNIYGDLFNPESELYKNSFNGFIPIYTGIIRSVKYDSKSISFTAEDYAEKKFYKEVPIARLNNEANCVDKEDYLKPIPFSYGEVNYAPVKRFININDDQRKVYLLSDDAPSITGTERPITGTSFIPNTIGNWTPFRDEPALFVYSGDYCFIPQKYETVGGSYYDYDNAMNQEFLTVEYENGNYGGYNDFNQWYNYNGSQGVNNLAGDYLGYYYRSLDADEDHTKTSSTMNNEIQAWHIRFPSEFKILNFFKQCESIFAYESNSEQLFYYQGIEDGASIQNPSHVYNLSAPGEQPYQTGNLSTSAIIPNDNLSLTDYIMENGHIDNSNNFINNIPINASKRGLAVDILYRYCLNENNEQELWNIELVNIPSWNQVKSIINDSLLTSSPYSFAPLNGLANYYNQDGIKEHKNYIGLSNGIHAINLIDQLPEGFDTNLATSDLTIGNLLYRYDREYEGSNILYSVICNTDTNLHSLYYKQIFENLYGSSNINNIIDLRDIWSFDEHFKLRLTAGYVNESENSEYCSLNFDGEWNGILNRHGCEYEGSAGVSLGVDFSAALYQTGIEGNNIVTSSYSNNLALKIKNSLIYNSIPINQDTILPIYNDVSSTLQSAQSFEMGMPNEISTSKTFTVSNEWQPNFASNSWSSQVINEYYEGDPLALTDSTDDLIVRGLFLSQSYSPSPVEGINPRGCYTFSSYRMNINYDKSSYEMYNSNGISGNNYGNSNIANNTANSLPSLAVRSGSMNSIDSEGLSDNEPFLLHYSHNILDESTISNSIDWTPGNNVFSEGGNGNSWVGGLRFLVDWVYYGEYEVGGSFPYLGEDYVPYTIQINDYGSSNTDFNTNYQQNSDAVSMGSPYGTSPITAGLGGANNPLTSNISNMTYHHWWDSPNAANTIVTSFGLDLNPANNASYQVSAWRELNLQIQRATLLQRLELADFSSKNLYTYSKGRSPIGIVKNLAYLSLDEPIIEEIAGLGSEADGVEQSIERAIQVWLMAIISEQSYSQAEQGFNPFYTSTPTGTLLYQLLTNPQGGMPDFDWWNDDLINMYSAAGFYSDYGGIEGEYADSVISDLQPLNFSFKYPKIRVSPITGKPVEKVYFQYQTGHITTQGSMSAVPGGNGSGVGDNDIIGSIPTGWNAPGEPTSLETISFDLEHLNRTGRFIDRNGTEYDREHVILTWDHLDFELHPQFGYPVSGSETPDDVFSERINIRLCDTVAKIKIDGENVYIPLLFNFMHHLIGVRSSVEYEFINSIVTNPSHVLKHLAVSEIGIPKEFIEFEEIVEGDYDYNLAFSVDKLVNSKKLLERIATNSQSFPIYKTSDNKFVVSDILNEYNEDRVNVEIKSDDVSKMKLSFTPSEDIKYNVLVKYGKDYESGELQYQTSNLNISSLLVNYDNNYYSLDDPNDAKLEFEAEYIRDERSANRLRDFLCFNSCNQHAVMEITLPITYLALEIGDVIKFDNIIDNLKILGEDYTKENMRNGQIIYPYFKIIKTKKTLKNITIKVYQLHKLVVDTLTMNEIYVNPETGVEEQPIFGCTVKWANNYNPEATHNDGSCEYTEYCHLNGTTIEMSNAQCELNGGQIVMPGDVSFSNTIDLSDLIIWIEQFNQFIAYGLDVSGTNNPMFLNMDVNLDGEVNVQDLVELINLILGYEPMWDE